MRTTALLVSGEKECKGDLMICQNLKSSDWDWVLGPFDLCMGRDQQGRILVGVSSFFFQCPFDFGVVQITLHNYSLLMCAQNGIPSRYRKKLDPGLCNAQVEGSWASFHMSVLLNHNLISILCGSPFNENWMSQYVYISCFQC